MAKSDALARDPEAALTARPPNDPVAYDAWFREQVEYGLHAANDPNVKMVPHDKVMRELREMRDR